MLHFVGRVQRQEAACLAVALDDLGVGHAARCTPAASRSQRRHATPHGPSRGRRRSAFGWGPQQLYAVLRFSTLGMISVAALILSGIVNACMLVGSFRALLVTD